MAPVFELWLLLGVDVLAQTNEMQGVAEHVEHRRELAIKKATTDDGRTDDDDNDDKRRRRTTDDDYVNMENKINL